MMGRREDSQVQFLYAFDLDQVVPPDHLVRQIDGVLDLSWVHKELAPYYSHTGRPSIDPVLMIRMLLVGYVFALRSERRLCSEVQVNLAYRWFCKLSVEDQIPDHSVFCRARHERFRESDALRRVFEGVVARKITRDVNEDVRDRVRALANTEAFQRSRRERKKVEMRFAHMKRILRLDRFRLRGLSGVRDEVLLTATAQNLRRLVKLLGRGPPTFAAARPV
jgi:transposase